MIAKFSCGIGNLAQADDGSHGSLRGVMRPCQSQCRRFRVHRSIGYCVGDVPRISAAGITIACEQRGRIPRGRLQVFVDGMSRFHPCHHVDGLPGGADVEAHAAAVFSIHGIVHGIPGLVVLRRFGGIIRSIQTEAQHFSGTRFDGRHHDFHAGGIFRWDGVARGFVQQGVGIDIQRGDDLQTAFFQQLFSILTGLAEFLGIQDLVHHVIAEIARIIVRGHATGGNRLDIKRICERSIDRLLIFRIRNIALLVHQLQHDIALLLGFRLVRFDGRIVSVRILGDCRDGGGLHDVQLICGGVEIPLRSRLHAIEAIAAKLCDIEISLQNFRLGILLFHLHGNQHFPHFSCDGIFRRMVLCNRIVILLRLQDQHVFDILLGKGGTALMVALHIRLDERAEHTLHINAAVSEESSVFTRYHGLLHVFGNLLQRHDFTILIPEFGDFRGAIGSVHGRLLRQAGHIKINTFDRQRRNNRLGDAVRAKNRR